MPWDDLFLLANPEVSIALVPSTESQWDFYVILEYCTKQTLWLKQVYDTYIHFV